MTRQHDQNSVPAVSIGMPLYNGENYIREALDSLLAQTFTDFELIISDNASEDGTGSICQEYVKKDARVQYVRQADNFGAAANFRYVLDQARGDYFMWAACDDYWSPTFISECVHLLRSHGDVGFAVTKYRIISRFCFIFSRVFVPSLAFVADSDRKKRVLSFSRLPIVSHKDNIVYALWRRAVILHILSNLKKASLDHLLGSAMNEYALSLYKGGFINKVLFRKKYRSLVPGHLLNPVVGLFLNSPLRLLGKPVKEGDKEKSRRQQTQHLIDIVKVLRLAGFDDDFIDEIVRLHKPYLRYVDRISEWRSLLGESGI